MQKYFNDRIFQIITATAKKQKTRAFVIGGFVRDLILKRPSNDLDIVVEDDGIEFAKAIARQLPHKPKVVVFKRFRTAMLQYKNIELEFVGARKESYNKDSRNPIVQKGSLTDDQNRRDFTINALAISMNEENFGELIDPFNGIQDIENKILRTPLSPDKTFSDDPLRMMRAVRFATQLNFKIDKKTLDGIQKNAKRIEIVSQERITTELNKILLSKQPSIGFKYMDETGLLKIILPELHNLKGIDVKNGIAHKDNFLHTIQVVDNIALHTDNLWLRWAALLHDIAKPATKRFTGNAWTFHGHEYLGYKMTPKIFKRLHLPLGQPMEYVRKLVRLHLRPVSLVTEEITDSAIRRMLFDAGDDIDDLMVLCEADITSSIEQKVNKFKSNYKRLRVKMKELEENDKLRNWQPPVSGDEIMATFGLKPSRTIGVIKEAIKEAILEGEIRNDKAEAVAFMVDKAKKLGLTVKNNNVFDFDY